MLWLWPRPAAMASIRPLAWEPPNAMGAALKRQKKTKKKPKRTKEMRNHMTHDKAENDRCARSRKATHVGKSARPC